MTTRALDLPILEERISVDNETLLHMHTALMAQCVEKERALSTSRLTHKNNYLQYAVARLAYGFTKEEYQSVVNEMVKRGLIAS
ncbi:MAG: hypothetical protein LBQ68_01705 [Clostridiales bacterium]|jgi:hypothetical protein|nr:hypothetical protein [Clostridiales bacterium]